MRGRQLLSARNVRKRCGSNVRRRAGKKGERKGGCNAFFALVREIGSPPSEGRTRRGEEGESASPLGLPVGEGKSPRPTAKRYHPEKRNSWSLARGQGTGFGTSGEVAGRGRKGGWGLTT